MKRNSFIRLSLAFSSLLSAPLAALAKRALKGGDKGSKVAAGKDRFGRPLKVFGSDTFFCKVSSTDCDGGLYIFESTRLDEGGPPLHYHYTQDEWWYVLSGEFLIKVGNETFHAHAGDSVFGPRQVP